jgi:hypothetical protein
MGIRTERRRIRPFTILHFPSSILHSLARLHRDQSGTISILTVLTLLVFTMLLGMLVNIGRQVDDKIKLQNAADAAGYSSGVVIARGMNLIAFTNHMLSEVFAMTAYMREGRDKGSEPQIPEILAAWQQVAQQFSSGSGTLTHPALQKIVQAGPAVAGKVPLEQDMVRTFSAMTTVKSQLTLPVLEYILGQNELNSGAGGNASATHLIPEFQRAVVQTLPTVARYTASEVAGRHGPAQRIAGGAQGGGGTQSTRSRPLDGVLWRTRVEPVGSYSEVDPWTRTVPAVDPSNEGPDSQQLGAQLGTYQSLATRRRNDLARHYLEQWITGHTFDGTRPFDLAPFEREAPSQGGRVSAKMSRFIDLWRIFTCGQLNELLNIEYPTTNLPHMFRTLPNQLDQNKLEQDHMFVSVVYWPQKPQFFPGMFRHPLERDAIAFSQVFVFIPEARFTRGGNCANGWCRLVRVQVPGSNPPVYTWECLASIRENWPREWDLFNQNWMAKLVPATATTLADVIRTPPTGIASAAQPPNLTGITTQDISYVNMH